MAHKPKYLDAAGCRSVRGYKQVRFRSSQKTSFSGWKKLLYSLIWAVFFGAIIYSIFFSHFLALTEIKISGTEKLDPAEIKKIVEAEITGNYLNIIPRNNILLVSKKSIEDEVIQKYKYAKSVEITKEFPSSLAIEMEERKFSLVLCGGEKCFVVQDSGAVFWEADFEKNDIGEKDLPILFDGGNKNFSLGESVISREYVDYLSGIKEEVKNKLGLDIEREFRTPQIASGDIRAKTSEGWQIYFDKSIQLNKEIAMLELILQNKISSDQRSELEYVDLRAENKVYYKFRNSEKQTDDQPVSAEDKKN